MSMGGIGSGRIGGNPTAEATNAFVLTAKDILEQWPRGTVGSGTIFFRSRWSDDLFVHARIDTWHHWTTSVELAHQTRTRPPEWIAYSVPLVTTRPTYGGERWW